MDVPSQMLTFVKVVDMGSFSAVARTTGQTPSAISKQISHLEDHVGARLLHRSRTGVELTGEGRAYLLRCRALAAKFNEAEAFISKASSAVNGVLHVASSVAFGKHQLIPALPLFLERYPDVTVSLELTDRHVDIEAELFDAAISFAEQMTNPNVIARKIMKNERVLCAAPGFIKRHGMPRTFSDLYNFNCLRTSNVKDRNAWQATLGGVSYTVDATGNFEGNSADAVLTAALAGLGIARLSTYMVAGKIASGELVQLFPAYRQQHADVAVTFAGKRNMAPKTRAFVDFLVEHFMKMPGGMPPVAEV
ncbi:MAG: LysR family transcriptional regulator [Sulfitobacter sp.]